MAPAGLATLPVEVIQHISHYLSVQDVLSCSLSCHYLRAALNDNNVWKKYLPEGISCLETQEQQVSSALDFSEEGLVPLCENRRHFVRKTRLMNNWREGHYVKYESCIEQFNSFTSALFKKTKGRGNTIYNDQYIFIGRYINDCQSNGIEIWNVSKNPVFHSFFKIEDVDYELFYIVGSYLVVVECVRISVYLITLPDTTFPLVYSFFITDNNASFNRIVEHRTHDFGCASWRHSIVGNYLMSSKCEVYILHVWDIYGASKVGSFEPPKYASSIVFHSFNGNICLFKLISQSHSTLNYLVTFDIVSKQFSQNCLTYESWVFNIIYFDSYIILFKSEDPTIAESSNAICTLYDFCTTLEMKRRLFVDYKQNRYILCSPLVVNGTFVILYQGSIHIINALTLETVDHIKYGDISYIIKNINLYQSIIVVGSTECNKLELLDVNRKRLLFNELCDIYDNHVYLDALCTKIVFVERKIITVVHLW